MLASQLQKSRFDRCQKCETIALALYSSDVSGFITQMWRAPRRRVLGTYEHALVARDMRDRGEV